jgi:hypothetical protein
MTPSEKIERLLAGARIVKPKANGVAGVDSRTKGHDLGEADMREFAPPDEEEQQPDASPDVEPFDLWHSLPPVPALPRGLLPATIEEFAFAKPTVFGPAALSAAALATCAIATTDNVRVEINATWHESFRLWVALYGPSSANKSPTLTLATRPVKAEQARRVEAYQLALDVWERREKAAKKAHSEFDEHKPMCGRLYSTNATIEALSEVHRGTDHGIGLIHDELSSLIAAMDGSYKDKSANERGNWLALYDGGPHAIDRVLRGQVFVKNHSATVIGGITTDKLRTMVVKMVADGLMSRMSFVCVPMTAPSDDLDPVPHDVYSAFEALVLRLVNSRPPNCVAVPLTAEARKVLGGAKMRWQAEQQRQSEPLPRFAERLGKMPGVAARLALGFALIEAAEGPGNSFRQVDPPRQITEDQMRRAVGYADHLLAHDLALYATAAGFEIYPPMMLAKKVGSWLLRHAIAQFLISEVTRGVLEWREFGGYQQFAALELLESLGWLTSITPDSGPAFRGRSFVRGARWVVNPRVHAVYATRAATERAAALDAKARLEAATEGNHASQC